MKSSWYERNTEEAKRRSKELQQANPERYRTYGRDSYHRRKNNPVVRAKNLWKHAKHRAITKQLPFDITPEDIVVPEICPIMGQPFGAVGSGPYAPSVDRIIPYKGYVKDNIRVISLLANQMKWNASPEELVIFCRGMLKLLGKESQAAC
jgi:hypothetical protein